MWLLVVGKIKLVWLIRDVDIRHYVTFWLILNHDLSESLFIETFTSFPGTPKMICPLW